MELRAAGGSGVRKDKYISPAPAQTVPGSLSWLLCVQWRTGVKGAEDISGLCEHTGTSARALGTLLQQPLPERVL